MVIRDNYLHDDIAPAHSALKVRNYLAKNKVPVLPQPPYSPELAPCDFYLFPKLKIVMKCQCQCQDDVDVKELRRVQMHLTRKLQIVHAGVCEVVGPLH